MNEASKRSAPVNRLVLDAPLPDARSLIGAPGRTRPTPIFPA